MKQQTSQRFVSECGKAQVLVDGDMPLGAFHDFLLELKGMMVDRMVQAQVAAQAEVAAQKASEEVPAEPNAPAINPEQQ